MRFPVSVRVDRIAAGAACSYGIFWAIALGAVIVDRKGFHPNPAYYFAVGFALTYIALSVLALFRIKGSTRLLQIITIVCTALVVITSGVLFLKESTLGRGLLLAFGQLQVAYAVGLCLLLEHKDGDIAA